MNVQFSTTMTTTTNDDAEEFPPPPKKVVSEKGGKKSGSKMAGNPPSIHSPSPSTVDLSAAGKVECHTMNSGQQGTWRASVPS
jgi:hypothetical protein